MNPEALILSNPLTPDIVLSVALLLLPFISFLFLIFNQGIARRTGSVVAIMAIGITFLISLWLFAQVWTKDLQHFQIPWFQLWFPNKVITLTIGILLDNITVLLLVVVTFVSLLVHLFSVEYMKSDPGYNRYYAFLGLFTFSMLGIVLADNLLVIFIFWELVGLSSYLLIGFWFAKPAAAAASKKAFLINRIGDLGFLIALMILWSRFDTLDLQYIKVLAANLPQDQLLWSVDYVFDIAGWEQTLTVNWLTIAGLGLFCGAIAKSAQFPLQIWLPDAMEGPTPVSALIHAATMVAAGVFLLARVFTMLNMDALTVIAFIGAITAFMGAFAAFTQNDIKKVLAYSTISQLGYMVMGMGTGAYDAALFHLITHAFFKACLFLCAGSVIHSLHKFEHDHEKLLTPDFNAQDMRFMGGLRKKLPVTFVAYTIATASLIGLPFFSGFLSKDALLTGAWAWAEAKSGTTISIAYLVPDLAFITVLMTAAYMTRQFIMVFLGDFRGALEQGLQKIKIQESSLLIKAPLIILALLSLGFVFSINPFSTSSSWVMEGVTHHDMLLIQFIDNNVHALLQVIIGKYEDLHFIISIVAVVMTMAGIAIGFHLYRFQKQVLEIAPTSLGVQNIFHRISANNWYLDRIYTKVIVRGLIKTSRKLGRFDSKTVDGTVNFIGRFYVIISFLIAWFDRTFVDGVVKLAVYTTGSLGFLTKDIQGGKVQNYFVWAFFGLIAIFLFMLL